MLQRAQRLKQARINAGFTSASAAARRLSIPVATYSAHENGGRAFSVEDGTLYARRFGVSLEWLLTGQGDAAPRPEGMRGTPVIGAISFTAWEDRPPIDLRALHSAETLQIAVVAGGPDANWFAASIPEGLEWPSYSPGDYLLAREVPEAQPNTLCICERTGFGGQLRQLVPAQCMQVNGGWALVLRSSNPELDGAILGEEGRLLGQIEALYRAL